LSENGHPLHIVSVLTTHATGGAEYAAVDMLDALARRGARVKLLTNRTDLVAGTSVEARAIELGPKLRRSTTAHVATQAPLSLFRLVRALRGEARTAPIDVLLFHYKKEQLLSVAIPPRLASAVVWAEWGPLPVSLRTGLAKRAYVAASRAADLILAESGGSARSLAEAGVAAGKIVVIPNILDDHGLAFDPIARDELRRSWGFEDAFVLGCISRLDPAKRVDVVIDALAHTDERVVLVIAGDGADHQRLRRRAARFGARVRFIDSARGRVAELLSACDVQVYAPGPSEGAARAVSFGQLVGRPVIATAPEGAEGLVVAGTGLIVTPSHDVRALARAVATYASDPVRVAAEGEAGRLAAVDRIRRADALPALESALRTASQGGRRS
jgi:glycosyltransferase involved in cell wall biosynthesis